jgi:phage tail protein X
LAAAGVNIANSPGTQSWSPRLAVDGQGNVHAVWWESTGEQNGDIFYSKGNRDATSWSTPLNLSNTNDVYTGTLQVCGIDADQNNNVYVIYTDGRDVKLRINQGGTWGSAIILDSIPSDRTDRCDAPRVEVAPSGDIFTIWFYANYREVFSRARINGVWENKQQLNSGRGSKITDIAIGTNIVAATWTEKHDYLDIYQVAHVYRSRTFNSTWSAITHVCPSEDNQQYPCVEVDSNDISHVVWTTEIGERVVKYVQGSGTSFTSPVDLSPLELLHYPSMTERNNNLYVCWQVGAYGGGQTVDFHNKIGGTWQGRGEVPSSSGCTFPDVAVSRYEDRRYYAWESNNDIYVHVYIIQVSSIQPIITGTVRTPTGSGLSSVTLTGLPSGPTTPASGVYSDAVFAGWTGTVTPVRSGYTFSPAGRSYSDVIANRVVQDYVGASNGCTYNIAPSLQTFVEAGGAGSVTVTAGAGCAWSAASQSAWIVINSGSSGSGNGTVQFTVGANSGSTRTGTLIVAGQTVTVHQEGDFLFNTSAAYVVLPEASWAAATGGGVWVSEVQITDVTGGSWVSAYFSYGGGSRRGPIYVWNNTGGDKRSVKFSNLLSYLGTVDTTFNYYGRVGAVEFVTQDANHTIQVIGRTLNGGVSKTLPGLIPAPENMASVSRPMLVQNLTNNASYRTSCGFFNPWGASVAAEFRLRSASGATLGSPFSRTFVGYDFQSFNPFTQAGVAYPGTSSDNAHLVITPTSGSGALIGFGSSVSNTTNDPASHLAVHAQGSHQNSPASDVIAPECIWAAAYGGGTWMTAIQITDLTGGSVVSVYFSYGGGARRGPYTVWTNSGGAGQSFKSTNFLSTLSTIDTGFTYYGRVGALEVVTQDSSHKVQVAARVRNGAYSKTFPGLQATDGNTADTSHQILVQSLTNNSAYRSSCGFYNPTASSVVVEFRLYAADGSAVGSAFSRTFTAYDFQSFNPFTQAGVPYPASSYDNVILIVRPTSGSGKVMGFGSTVNNGSSDPAAHLSVQYR